MTAGPIPFGIDRVLRGDAALPRQARFALVTNMAARTRTGVWIGDALRDAGYRIAAFVSPEHGLTTTAGAGVEVGHGSHGGIPVWSMYGGEPERVEEALRSVDAVVLDLQDVGCRYYTYPWTAREVMRLATRLGKSVFALDRPNPLGDRVEGSLPDPGIDSPVCAARVPICHGLTLGELMRWMDREGGLGCDLQVIACKGWQRGKDWEDTGLPWVAPSPALPHFACARVYPATCLIEGTNLSEGRGTDRPFLLIGAPSLAGANLARPLTGHPLLQGIRVTPARFIPQWGKWQGEQCEGIELELPAGSACHLVGAGLAIIEALCTHPEFRFQARHFDALAGTSAWRTALEGGGTAEGIVAGWAGDEAWFRREREVIALY